MLQLEIDGVEPIEQAPHESKPSAAGPDLGSYDRFVVFFSGGKDSVACVLHLLDLGVPASKIELHHHLIDGQGAESALMDWPVTSAYCEAFSRHLGTSFKTSWREGGFLREMTRNETRTAPVVFYKDGVRISVGGVNGPLGTRCRFPQQSANLKVRWCSSSLKIDVGAAYLRNDDRFRHSRTLVVTGERAQESTARSRYAKFEVHRADNRSGASGRHIDHWRPVHAWQESQVWEIMEKHRINPHPAYWLGWGRVSCMTCIFGSPHQWATIKQIAPARFAGVANFESDFGVTIHRKMGIEALAANGTVYQAARGRHVALALSETYSEPMVLDNWSLPPGAYAEGCGPT